MTMGGWLDSRKSLRTCSAAAKKFSLWKLKGGTALLVNLEARALQHLSPCPYHFTHRHVTMFTSLTTHPCSVGLYAQSMAACPYSVIIDMCVGTLHSSFRTWDRSSDVSRCCHFYSL